MSSAVQVLANYVRAGPERIFSGRGEGPRPQRPGWRGNMKIRRAAAVAAGVAAALGGGAYASAATTVTATTAATAARAGHGGDHHGAVDHVLLISVDGLHQQDLAWYAKAFP